jgi:hypothetical protein
MPPVAAACCPIPSVAVSLAGISSSKRPDALALIGPEYDRAASQPAARTLIICSAPRTGSYELCRYLLAAGIGVPHEYFNANYACQLGERWAFSKNPLESSELSRYIKALRRRRAQGGVFATKLQFTHFNLILRNEHGRELFDKATVIHLFRPDPIAQYASYRSALESGLWDFSARPTLSPVVRDSKDFDKFLKQALRVLMDIAGPHGSRRRFQMHVCTVRHTAVLRHDRRVVPQPAPRTSEHC